MPKEPNNGMTKP